MDQIAETTTALAERTEEALPTVPRTQESQLEMLFRLAQTISDPERLRLVMEVTTAAVEQQRKWEKEDRLEQAKIAYHEAKARMQAKLPVLERDQTNPQTHSKYVDFGDAWERCSPIWGAEGFSVDFPDAYLTEQGKVRLNCRMSRGGHEEYFTTPDAEPDTKGPQGNVNKTLMHGTQSAITYLKRDLLFRAVGIAAKREDDDGNAGGGSVGGGDGNARFRGGQGTAAGTTSYVVSGDNPNAWREELEQQQRSTSKPPAQQAGPQGPAPGEPPDREQSRQAAIDEVDAAAKRAQAINEARRSPFVWAWQERWDKAKSWQEWRAAIIDSLDHVIVWSDTDDIERLVMDFIAMKEKGSAGQSLNDTRVWFQTALAAARKRIRQSEPPAESEPVLHLGGFKADLVDAAGNKIGETIDSRMKFAEALAAALRKPGADHQALLARNEEALEDALQLPAAEEFWDRLEAELEDDGEEQTGDESGTTGSGESTQEAVDRLIAQLDALTDSEQDKATYHEWASTERNEARDGYKSPQWSFLIGLYNAKSPLYTTLMNAFIRTADRLGIKGRV